MIGIHTFRATGITAYLKNGGTLENAAAMANHASTLTTQLYDRHSDGVSLDDMERIRVWVNYSGAVLKWRSLIKALRYRNGVPLSSTDNSRFAALTSIGI
ncbi:hypothetical protein [Pseudomonas sp. MAG733B]|uniref:hypothetical protein n=1 Tax=Pseudomonas sp. MAG733B TaxID=3122079 RepID=UPI0030CD0521